MVYTDKYFRKITSRKRKAFVGQRNREVVSGLFYWTAENINMLEILHTALLKYKSSDLNAHFHLQ